MSKYLEVQLTDEVFAKLEHLAQVSGISSVQAAGIILCSTIEKLSQPEAVSETFDFESTLNYALQKNEELLQRLAK